MAGREPHDGREYAARRPQRVFGQAQHGSANLTLTMANSSDHLAMFRR